MFEVGGGLTTTAGLQGPVGRGGMPNSLRESSWIVLVAGAGDGSALGEGTGANGGGEAEEARCLPRRAEEEPCATA